MHAIARQGIAVQPVDNVTRLPHIGAAGYHSRSACHQPVGRTEVDPNRIVQSFRHKASVAAAVVQTVVRRSGSLRLPVVQKADEDWTVWTTPPLTLERCRTAKGAPCAEEWLSAMR